MKQCGLARSEEPGLWGWSGTRHVEMTLPRMNVLYLGLEINAAIEEWNKAYFPVIFFFRKGQWEPACVQHPFPHPNFCCEKGFSTSASLSLSGVHPVIRGL